MAEVTRARTGLHLRSLFEMLLSKADGMPAQDAIEGLAKNSILTDYEKGNYPSGGNRFEKILRFATVDAVKAGWFVKHKGIWSITEKGKKAYQDYSDPEAFYKEAVRLYNAWKKSQPLDEQIIEPDNIAEETVEKNPQITIETAEEQAWSEIESFLRNMPPYEFQDLVADLLRAMGYHITWKSPPGKDGGIDILAYSDPLGTRPPRIKVQVKRYSSNISVDGLRSFLALLGDDDVGLFVTTSGFTKDAQDEARTQQSRKITLVDLDRFFDLWVEHYPKLDDTARRRFPLQPIYFLAPGG